MRQEGFAFSGDLVESLYLKKFYSGCVEETRELQVESPMLQRTSSNYI